MPPGLEKPLLYPSGRGTHSVNAVYKKPRIYFGWWTVLVTGVISGLGHGFYGLGISVFFKDLAQELGVSRAITSVAAGVGRLEGGITSPFTGWLVDKYGPKWVIFSGIIVAGVGLVYMRFIHSAGAYIVAWGVLAGVGINIGLTVAVDKSLNDWFVAKRGLAQGIKFGLISLASVAILPIAAGLVTSYGWRSTCLLWGFILLVCAPVSLLFVKQKRPEFYGLLPDGARMEANPHGNVEDKADEGTHAPIFEEEEYAFKAAIKTRAYWISALALSIFMFVYGAITVHTIPFLTDMGISRTVASAMMSLMVLLTVPSRFLGGIITDYVPKDRLNFLIAVVFFLQAVGIAVFLMNRDRASIYVMFILYGLGSGACPPLFILLMGRYFGRKAFGSILGSSLALRAPASLVSPVFAGWVYDRTGNYIVAFALFLALAAFATLLMIFLKPPVPSGREA